MSQCLSTIITLAWNLEEQHDISNQCQLYHRLKKLTAWSDGHVHIPKTASVFISNLLRRPHLLQGRLKYLQQLHPLCCMCTSIPSLVFQKNRIYSLHLLLEPMWIFCWSLHCVWTFDSLHHTWTNIHFDRITHNYELHISLTTNV